jgi:hypothetical protein
MKLKKQKKFDSFVFISYLHIYNKNILLLANYIFLQEKETFFKMPKIAFCIY